MTTSWKYKVSFFIIMTIVTSGCIEPFQPQDNGAAKDLLVIDGFINSTNNSAEVRISHSVSLASEDTPMPELQAIVSVEDENGNSTLLTEQSPSLYYVGGLALDYQKKYKLTVHTQSGKIYQSDFIDLQRTPPIDSVTWAIEDNKGIVIKVNAHDDQNPNRYYKWNFSETWEYHSQLTSYFKIDGNKVITPREPEEFINICWSSSNSTSITIGSSKRLNIDLVRDAELHRVPKGSIKIYQKYSILVQQRKISEKEYNYWELLKQTTQSLGGLFDPLPATVKGNFTCTSDPNEPVLGFFGGGEVTEKRLFIAAYEIPPRIRQVPAGFECSIDTIALGDIADYNTTLFLLSSFGMPSIEGYYHTTRACMDCRLGGGTLTKPDFWE